MKYHTTVAILLFLAFGFASSQETVPTVEDLQKKLSEVSIPGLENVNASALPIEDAKMLLKKKCEKNGGPTAFDELTAAHEKMTQCFQSLVNITEIEAKMEKAKPTGDLDLVFKEYCEKRPIIQSCIKNYTNAIGSCLDAKEQESKEIILNITQSLLGFVCFKEGDRIALFISAGGPECMQSKQGPILECLNKTLSGYIPESDGTPGSALPGLDALPNFSFGEKECKDFQKIQNCVVTALETCEDPTPANIVDSVLNFIKKVTPCKNMSQAEQLPSTGVQKSGSSTTALSALLTTVAMVLLRSV